MAEREGARKSSVPIVVCTAPDFCKTPVGNSTPPIPYQIIANFQDSEAVSPDVRFGGDPAFLLDQSFISQVTGDEPGTAGGVRSGVNKSIAKPKEGSKNVRVDKKPVVRDNDAFEMNKGNTQGICIYQPGSGPSCSFDPNGEPTGDVNPPVQPGKPAELEAAKEGKGIWSKASPIVHGVLGVASFVPGLSVITGAADGFIYGAEGNYFDAALSFGAMAPGGKIVTTAGKLAKGAIKAEKVAKAAAAIRKTEAAIKEGELATRELKAANALRQTEKQLAKQTATAKKASSGVRVLEPDFIGTLKGKLVKLKGVKEKKIKYTKRDPEEASKLRKEFNSGERKKFLEDLANDPEKVEQLRKAGLTEPEITLLKKGGVPDGWQVHHKLPLDDGGTNKFDNLVLIKNDPYHQVITNAQGRLTGTLNPGDTRVIKFPVPDGFVYPPGP